MSASGAISIPRKAGRDNAFSNSSPSSSSSSSSSAAIGPASPSFSSASSAISPSQIPTPGAVFHPHHRRPSLLSSSVRKVEHSVFDLGIRDGSPRLLTCVKASQGFDWNLDIFLPSSSDISFQTLSERMEPVHEIILTDEEGERMLPS